MEFVFPSASSKPDTRVQSLYPVPLISTSTPHTEHKPVGITTRSQPGDGRCFLLYRWQGSGEAWLSSGKTRAIIEARCMTVEADKWPRYLEGWLREDNSVDSFPIFAPLAFFIVLRYNKSTPQITGISFLGPVGLDSLSQRHLLNLNPRLYVTFPLVRTINNISSNGSSYHRNG